MLSGNCADALSIRANVTISGSSAKLIKNDIAPLPFPLPALLKKYYYIKRGERVRVRGHAPFYATLGLTSHIRLLVRGLFLVGRMQVEVDAAQGPLAVGLAENNCQLPIERDAVTQVRAAVQVGLDGFFHQACHRFLAFVRSFVDADNVLLVMRQRLEQLRLEQLDRQIHEHRN